MTRRAIRRAGAAGLIGGHFADRLRAGRRHGRA